MRDPRTMDQVAQACVAGGAAGIRAQGLADLALICQHVKVPVIGLWKDGHEGVLGAQIELLELQSRRLQDSARELNEDIARIDRSMKKLVEALRHRLLDIYKYDARGGAEPPAFHRGRS